MNSFPKLYLVKFKRCHTGYCWLVYGKLFTLGFAVFTRASFGSHQPKIYFWRTALLRSV